MPEACRLAPEDRRAWYDSYRRTFLERDLRQISEISNVPEFGRLTSLALLRTGGLLNKSQLASDAKISHSTADRYLGLLEVAYQIRLLSPYFPNVGKRLVKSPKLFAVDCGAASWAANAWDWRAAVAAGRDGALLETFAVSDVIAWDALTGASQYHFWRTSACAEVDLVVERGDRIVGIEFKASRSLGHRDASGLRALQGDAGPRFQLGVLAYLGEEVRMLGERLVAVPLSSFLGVTK
jgi:predicted AAA+ superfamily ATPase